MCAEKQFIRSNNTMSSMDAVDKNGSSCAQSQAISLDQIIHITDMLAGLVQDMLGPAGQQTLLSTHTGKALVTRDGLAILNSLHIGHPVGRCIVQSLQSYCSVHCDGSKTFMLYLSQALRAIRDQLNRDGLQSPYARARLASELNQYMNTNFEQIVELVLNKMKSNSANCHETVMSTAIKVLKTSLHTCLHKHLTAFFTDMLSSFLSLSCPRPDNVEQRLAHLLQNFSMYHTKVPTQPQQKSRICHGVLLETDLSADQIRADAQQYRKFALMDVDFDGDEKERGGNSVSVHLSSATVADLLGYKRKSFHLLLSSLQAAGLDILICSDVVPQFVVGMCKEKGISIQCVQHEKLVFLSALTGVPIVKDMCQRDHKGYMFSASMSSFVRIGNKTHTLIELSRKSCSILPLKHMIVCAPTEGLCDQLCQSLYKALKAVHEYLTPFDWNSMRISVPSNVFPVHDSGSLRPVLACVSQKGSNVHVEGDTSNSACDKSIVRNRKGGDACFENQQHSSPSSCPLFTVSVGGTFEALVSCAISEASPQNSLSRQRIDKLIKKMLVSVPQTLHARLCSTKHGQQRQFTETWTSMLSSVSQGRLFGLGVHGDKDSVCESTSVSQYTEPLVPKLSLVAHVLQLLVQLLRLEAVVPVRKLPNGDNQVRNSPESEAGGYT